MLLFFNVQVPRIRGAADYFVVTHKSGKQQYVVITPGEPHVAYVDKGSVFKAPTRFVLLSLHAVK